MLYENVPNEAQEKKKLETGMAGMNRTSGFGKETR